MKNKILSMILVLTMMFTFCITVNADSDINYKGINIANVKDKELAKKLIDAEIHKKAKIIAVNNFLFEVDLLNACEVYNTFTMNCDNNIFASETMKNSYVSDRQAFYEAAQTVKITLNQEATEQIKQKVSAMKVDEVDNKFYVLTTYIHDNNTVEIEKMLQDKEIADLIALFTQL